MRRGGNREQEGEKLGALMVLLLLSLFRAGFEPFGVARLHRPFVH